MRSKTIPMNSDGHRSSGEPATEQLPVDRMIASLQAQVQERASGTVAVAVPRGDYLIELGDGRVLVAAIDSRTGAVFGIETLALVEIAQREREDQRVVMSPAGTLLDVNELIGTMHVEGIALGGGLCRYPPHKTLVPYVVLRPSVDAVEDSTMAFRKLCEQTGPFESADVIATLFSNYDPDTLGMDDASAVGLIWVQADHVWMIEHDGEINGLLGSDFVPIPAWQEALQAFRAARAQAEVPDSKAERDYLVAARQFGKAVYWSNKHGWIDNRSDATMFPSKDVDLPMGAQAVRWVAANEQA